jgi:hypothetical protein
MAQRQAPSFKPVRVREACPDKRHSSLNCGDNDNCWQSGAVLAVLRRPWSSPQGESELVAGSWQLEAGSFVKR